MMSVGSESKYPSHLGDPDRKLELGRLIWSRFIGGLASAPFNMRINGRL